MKQKQNLKNKPNPISPQTTFTNWKIFFLTGSIVLVTYFSFSPAAKNSFTNWDDNAYVFENIHLSKPLPEAIKFFFEPHYFIGNYIPLTMITYAIEYQVAGLKPQFYHSVNIFIHLLNVLLVFWFIYLLSGKKPIVAAIVALFFGTHPMHVESVAWITELKDVLYGLFFLAGLISYYKYVQKGTEKFPWLALIFFVLSTLSKPAAIVFPVVLLLLDFYTWRKFDKWVWIEKLPFFIISVVFGIITINSQHSDRLIHDYYPFSQRVLFASHSFLNYIVKLFLPFNLSIYYPYPVIVNGRLPYSFFIAPALLVLLAYGIYKTLKYSRLIAFGFLFFFANIILVLQLISIGDAIMADRYTYIPYIGLFFMLAMGFDRLYHNSEQKLITYKRLAITLIFAFAVLCSYLTHARCKVWKNDDTIGTDLINKFPDDRLALNNKGFLLYMQGKYQESIELFIKAIERKPDYVMAHINLTNSYLALNDYDNALKTIDQALRYAPQDYNLLNNKGTLLSRKQNYMEAMKLHKEAIRLKKDDINGYLYLAEVYFALKDYDNALKTCDIAMKYHPDNYILLNNKGYVLFVMGQYAEALEYFKASLKYKPDYSIASVNLKDCIRALDEASKVRR